MIEEKGKRVFWVVALIVVGGLLYLGNNRYGGLFGLISHFNVQHPLERYIPFVPSAIFAYYLMFVFLSLPIFFVKSYKEFRKVVRGYWIITFISAFIFFFFPTTMPRPETVQHEGIIRLLFYGIYSVDGPHNLFPSLHVSSTTYILFVNNRFWPKGKILNILMAISINISTLLIKQHAVIDVIGGVLLGIFVFWLIFKRGIN